MDSTPPAYPSAELEVPGEPGVYWCARHRKVKTRLRCGRCERPICPKCTVMGPTGARCPDCASNRTSHVYKVGPAHLALTFLAMTVLSAVGAAIVSTGLGLFIILFAPAVGTMLGKVVTRVTHGKRGAPLAMVASLGAVAGALGPRLALALFALLVLHQYHPPRGAHLPPGAALPDISPMLLLTTVADPWLWLYLIIVIPALWYWIK